MNPKQLGRTHTQYLQLTFRFCGHRIHVLVTYHVQGCKVWNPNHRDGQQKAHENKVGGPKVIAFFFIVYDAAPRMKTTIQSPLEMNDI